MTDDAQKAKPKQDKVAEQAADLILEAEEEYQETLAKQEEFLETVAEEEGAEVLETECNIMGDYTVPLRAKLNGDIMDAMGRIEGRLERIQSGDAHAYEIGDTADEVSQLLAGVIDDAEWHKEMFYQAYKDEGIDALGVMLERAFEALKDERERRRGTADGFRQKPEGS